MTARDQLFGGLCFGSFATEPMPTIVTLHRVPPGPSQTPGVLPRLINSDVDRAIGRLLALAGEAVQFIHLRQAADAQWHTLMNFTGLDFQNPVAAVGSHSACLFRDEGNRIGFV